MSKEKALSDKHTFLGITELSWGGYSQIVVDDACKVSPTFGVI